MDELEKKIQEIRAKLEAETNCRKAIKSPNLLIELFAGIATGGFLGYYLDSYFQAAPIFLLILSVLGMVAGIVNYIRCREHA